jgi:hypothetical protein
MILDVRMEEWKNDKSIWTRHNDALKEGRMPAPADSANHTAKDKVYTPVNDVGGGSPYTLMTEELKAALQVKYLNCGRATFWDFQLTPAGMSCIFKRVSQQ